MAGTSDDPLAGDDAELAVLADELQQQGDPHGELIATGLAQERLPRDAPMARRGLLERRFAALLDTHHDRLFGTLAPNVQRASRPDLLDPALQVMTWRGGFVHDAWLKSTMHGPNLLEVYRRARPLRVLARLRTLRVGVGLGPGFAAALAEDPPPLLRELVLRPDGFGQSPIWRGQREEGLADLGPLAGLAGRLESLVVERNMRFPPLHSTTLRTLRYVHPREDGPSFATSELPALRELVISDGRIEVGFCDRFPALEKLTMYSVELADGWLAQLLGSPALVRMRELHLTLAPDDLRLLARHADRVSHLTWMQVRCRAPDVAIEVRPQMPPNVTIQVV